MALVKGNVLVVDDHQDNREILYHHLVLEGYSVVTANNGQEALEVIAKEPFDLILLDIMMPVMNGYEVLERLKTDDAYRHIPVVVISARDDVNSIVRCIELGAEDYLAKPFNTVLLRARINASLDRKRFQDLQLKYLQELENEQERSERLLLNILPSPIAEQLKNGNRVVADTFNSVTVLFADIVDFTPLASKLHPVELVALLNNIFSTFDRLAEEYNLEKIKTIGDAYMVVGGLPTPREDHAEAVASMALAMQKAISQFSRDNNRPFEMRIGIATGPVVAGVIGAKKFAYDLWGDTVNIANRMESHGLAGAIQVTYNTYQQLKDTFNFELRGPIEVKGKGTTEAYLLIDKKE